MTLRTNRIDITCKIGPLAGSPVLTRKAEWPMYSYDRPASLLWNAIANALYNRGWTEDEIRDWLTSKNPRFALDGSFGDLLKSTGRALAATIPDSEKE